MAKSKLDSYKYSTLKGFDYILLKQSYAVLRRYFYGKTCIELGSADGAGTQFLVDYFDRVVAVDGSKRMLRNLKKNVPSKKLEIIQSYFENLDSNEKFDTIILAHVLEHVDNPVKILKIAKGLAHNKSKILIAVPNALSLHRQAGVFMGLLKNEYSLNKRDHLIGHQRIYDIDLLKKDVKRAGLKIIKTGGNFLKPFPNPVMKKIIGGSERMIKAYCQVGERYPNIASDIYIICTKKE